MLIIYIMHIIYMSCDISCWLFIYYAHYFYIMHVIHHRKKVRKTITENKRELLGFWSGNPNTTTFNVFVSSQSLVILQLLGLWKQFPTTTCIQISFEVRKVFEGLHPHFLIQHSLAVSHSFENVTAFQDAPMHFSG